MRDRSFSAERSIGKAEFADALSRVTVRKGSPVECVLYIPTEDGGDKRDVVGETFTLPGLGMDEAVWFCCPDPRTGREQVRVASELLFGSPLPGINQCATTDEMIYEVIKFVLRIPEDERADAWDRMKTYGALWRGKK